MSTRPKKRSANGAVPAALTSCRASRGDRCPRTPVTPACRGPRGGTRGRPDVARDCDASRRLGTPERRIVSVVAREGVDVRRVDAREFPRVVVVGDVEDPDAAVVVVIDMLSVQPEWISRVPSWRGTLRCGVRHERCDGPVDDDRDPNPRYAVESVARARVRATAHRTAATPPAATAGQRSLLRYRPPAGG